MEVGAHDIVIVAGHGADQRPVLPIPYPDGLIVGGGDDPWQLVVEKDGPHVVEMPVEREKFAPCGQRPHLDLVVVAAGHEEGLGLVEVDASDGTAVAFEPIDEGPHAICRRNTDVSKESNRQQARARG